MGIELATKLFPFFDLAVTMYVLMKDVLMTNSRYFRRLFTHKFISLFRTEKLVFVAAFLFGVTVAHAAPTQDTHTFELVFSDMPSTCTALTTEERWQFIDETVRRTRTQKPTEVVAWLRETLKQNGCQAIAALSVAYELGRGVEKNTPISLELLKKGAQLRDPMSMTQLARHLLACCGDGTAEARSLLEGASALDWDDALAEMGNQLISGRRFEKDMQKGMAFLERAAKQGNIYANNSLGGMYYFEGSGIPQDFPRALGYFSVGAERNNPLALHNLGIMYLNGQGVERDPAKAFGLFKRAADLGHESAIVSYAKRFLTGEGTPRDPHRGISIAIDAAMHGSGEAMAYLADLYILGIEGGLTRDPLAARTWATCAAERGNAMGMWILGWIYQYGNGVARDPETAGRWFERARSAGITDREINNLKPDLLFAEQRIGR